MQIKVFCCAVCNTVEMEWSQLKVASPVQPMARCGHSAEVLQQQIHIYGGLTSQGLDHKVFPISDYFVLDLCPASASPAAAASAPSSTAPSPTASPSVLRA